MPGNQQTHEPICEAFVGAGFKGASADVLPLRSRDYTLAKILFIVFFCVTVKREESK